VARVAPPGVPTVAVARVVLLTVLLTVLLVGL
jgi:hypothetical protein